MVGQLFFINKVLVAFKTLFFLCLACNVVTANITYDGAKITSWAGDTHPKAVENIKRYIRVILHNVPQNTETTGKFNSTLSKYCKGTSTINLDSNIEILRTWPQAGGKCAQKQYDLVMQALTQYDAQQLQDKDAEIASLRIAIQMLRDLNRRLKVEITGLEQFIAEDLERIIRTYMEYVDRTGHTFQTHDAHLQAHLAELGRLNNLIQGAGQARGMLDSIEATQAEASRLLADAERAGAQEIDQLGQQVQDAQAIIDSTTDSLAALQQQIRIINQTLNR